jgi:hypothetical protein
MISVSIRPNNDAGAQASAALALDPRAALGPALETWRA